MPVILNEEISVQVECDCGETVSEVGLTENDVMNLSCPKCGKEIIIETSESEVYNA